MQITIFSSHLILSISSSSSSSSSLDDFIFDDQSHLKGEAIALGFKNKGQQIKILDLKISGSILL